MNTKLLLAVLLTLFSTVFCLQAQSQISQSLPHVKYNKNINKPLTQSEKIMLENVYADKLNDYVLNKPNRLKSVKNILRNRIEILEMSSEKLSGMRKLSEVPLFNAYNSNLKRDAVFNKATFNPLKYQFSFYSRNSSFIRIDNTNYVIYIKSQFQQ